MVAGEEDDEGSRVGEVGERVGFAVGCRECERGCFIAYRECESHDLSP